MDNSDRRRSNRLKMQTTKKMNQEIIGIGLSIPDLDINVTHEQEQVESSGAKLEMVDSDNDNEWLERQDHPLSNKVILGIVFKHLRGRDLKKSRLVCKAWNISTIPFIRNTFPITIHGNDSERLPKIVNFMKVFRSNTLGIPFGRFKLGSFPTRNGVGKTFLRVCGNAIKSLEFLNEDIKVEDVSQLLRLTPNLESFQIPRHLQSRSGNIVKLFRDPEDSKLRLLSLKLFRIQFDNPKERNTFCPTFLEELIRAAPNISSFHLFDSFPFPGDKVFNFPSSFEVLSIVEKLDRESCIQELIISRNTSRHPVYFELLRKMTDKPNGLKLKKIEYFTLVSDENNDAIQLISIFKDTLEHLKLSDRKTTSFVEFPTMSRLKRASMAFCRDFDSRFVDLNNIFPVLRELKIEQVSEQFFPESEPCPTLKSFKLTNNTLRLSGFNRILTVFPNLIELRLEICDNPCGMKILTQIWSHMTQLESLSISGTVLTEWVLSMDSVLTGISTNDPQKCQEIVKSVRSLEKLTSTLERNETILKLRNQHCQLPSIGNLTNLRSLTLDLRKSNNYGGRIDGMCDVTGYLGLYSMKCLKHVDVQCQFTRTCCEILTEDMGLESWRFVTLQNKDIIPSNGTEST